MGSILAYLDKIRPEWQPGAVDPREGALLYWLIRNAQPHRIIEIGAASGYSTMWIAAAVEDNGVGAVITIDIEIDKVCAERFARNVINSGANRFVQKVVGNSTEIKNAVWCVAGYHGFYDFLFLDGDHMVEGVLKDLSEWLPHMAPHGIMVCHDTIKFFEDELVRKLRDYQSEFFDRALPGQVVRRLLDTNQLDDFTVMTLETSHGLTLIRRKAST